MMLIIDGPDLVGKTTLAKQLAIRLGLTYQHLSRLSPEFNHYHGYCDLMSRHVVRDRFHLSEIVYAHATRGGQTSLTPERYRLVDARLRLLGAVTVVVLATPELVGERYKTLAEREMYPLGQVLLASELFKELVLRGSSLKKYTVDVDCVIICDSNHPFPNDDDLEAICKLWRSRQDQLLATMRDNRQ